MKVLICDSVAKEAVSKLTEAGFEVDVKTGMTPEQVTEVIGNYEAVIVRSATKIRAPQIEAGTKLKVIARGGVGVDNIDVDVAKAKGIKVVNTPNASSISVAELALGMMFSLSRHLVNGTVSMRDGKWEKKAFEGVEIYGKTLGLIGAGRIGRELAKRAIACGMTVIAYDPFLTKVEDPAIPLVTKDEVLAKSDYLSLHIPLDKAVGASIKAEDFAKMKKNAFLINCARGGVVDEAALVTALNDGLIAGAAVDVWAKEPTDNTVLPLHPKIIAMPHVGASTVEGQYRVALEVADKVIECLKGGCCCCK